MFKINCHAHTVNSDGGNNILEMANMAKALGHSALVVTDHSHPRTAAYQANYAERRVLQEHNLLPLPVIIGAEIKTPMGEYLLFGKKVNKNWAEQQVDLNNMWGNVEIPEYVEHFKDVVLKRAERYTYGLILCHPRLMSSYPGALEDCQSWWSLVHGFEVQNYNEFYDDESKWPGVVTSLRDRMPRALELRNSDAHSAEDLSMICNETEKELTDESQLIAWFTNTRLGKCTQPTSS